MSTPDKRVEEIINNLELCECEHISGELQSERIRLALTQRDQDLMSERDNQWREHLNVILGTDIYRLHEKYFTPEYWDKAEAQTIIKLSK